MAVSVVVGGQFGSEGKGKVAQYLAAERRAAAVVRVGGPNSGHTGFTGEGERRVLRQLPTAALLPEGLCVLGPGSYIDVGVLLAEIVTTALPPERLLIDEKAMLVTREDRVKEQAEELGTRIGSTLSGTGAAVQRRIARRFETQRAGDVAELRPYIGDSSLQLRDLLARGERVVVEGTQGFGLSLLHSPFYPHVTSRDTSAAGAVAEAGLSPIDVDEVALVIRSSPIRVAGDSGPLPDEVSWESIALECGTDEDVSEFTSVTGRLRRVAHFNPEIVQRAIAVNQPTLIVLNHLDHIDARCREAGLTSRARAFIGTVSEQIDANVDLAGVGPTAIVSLGPSHVLAASN